MATKQCNVAIALDAEDKPFIRFGKMKAVVIFEVSDEGIREKEQLELPNIADFSNGESTGCHGKNDGYLNAVGELLKDCKYLIVGESGGYPARVLLRFGILVLEQEPGDIGEILLKILDYENKR